MLTASTAAASRNRSGSLWRAWKAGTPVGVCPLVEQVLLGVQGLVEVAQPAAERPLCPAGLGQCLFEQVVDQLQ